MKTPLPAFVADRLDKLAEVDEALTLYARAPMAAADQKRAQLGELKNQLAALAGAYSGVEVDPSQVEHLRKEAQKLEAQIESRVAEYVRRRELAITANHSVTAARDFLARLKDNVELEALPEVKLGANGDLRRLLSAVRNALADKQAALATTRRARLPESDLRARAEQFVERFAKSQSILPTVGIEPFTVRFVRPGTDPSGVPSPLALIAKLMPGPLVDAICEAAAIVPAGPEGLPESERPAKLAELENDVEGLERQEEALIVAILDQLGPTIVSRRCDARPEILLGVVVRPKPKASPVRPAESLEHELEAAE